MGDKVSKLNKKNNKSKDKDITDKQLNKWSDKPEIVQENESSLIRRRRGKWSKIAC